MSLEGRLRDLALSEVLQLLSLSRKTGVLAVRDALAGMHASIVVEEGWIVGCTLQQPSDNAEHNAPPQVDMLERVLSLLDWEDGDFHFAAGASGTASEERISTDVVLMEAARRADAWATVRDLVPGPSAIPDFPDGEPKQLPLLNLAPPQWEVLTLVDGARTITDLAANAGRDVIDIATIIHGLVAEGVLVMRDRGPRASDTVTPRLTPISTVAFDIPPVYSPAMPYASQDSDDDSIFDPMQTGVVTPEGLPRLATPAVTSRALHAKPRTTTRVTSGVATAPAQPSIDRTSTATSDSENALQAGDAAVPARHLEMAIEHWSSYVSSTPTPPDAARVRERITLARQLLALLQS